MFYNLLLFSLLISQKRGFKPRHSTLTNVLVVAEVFYEMVWHFALTLASTPTFTPLPNVINSVDFVPRILTFGGFLLSGNICHPCFDTLGWFYVLFLMPP